MGCVMSFSLFPGITKTVACTFEGCSTLYAGEMDALEPTIPRGWHLSPKSEPWCSAHEVDESDSQTTMQDSSES